jgi:hypothetical protein
MQDTDPYTGESVANKISPALRKLHSRRRDNLYIYINK